MTICLQFVRVSGCKGKMEDKSVILPMGGNGTRERETTLGGRDGFHGRGRLIAQVLSYPGRARSRLSRMPRKSPMPGKASPPYQLVTSIQTRL